MSITVLVVDGERPMRSSLSQRLHRCGYDVITAETGEEARQAVATQHPDAMLLDLFLPGLSGLETLHCVLAARPGLPVLMMSAHSTVEAAVQAMKQGAVDFLVKPFSLDLMEKAVARALAVGSARRHLNLTGDPGASDSPCVLIGESESIRNIRETVSRLCAGNTTVLIEGESGTGKELVARAIHFLGARASKPFLEVNCAALPEQLLESELFGHERGAFTDAKAQKPGLFETANGGTVMLDEIGDLPAAGQAKLLRLLENKSFRRLGGIATLSTDVRVIAATNANLEERVAEGRFRADLYFRLNVVRVNLPPLRDGRTEIPVLTAHFIARFNREMNRSVKGLSPRALELLSAYRWPGNVRELRNFIERAFILHPELTEIDAEHLPVEARRGLLSLCAPIAVARRAVAEASGNLSLDLAERRLIDQALEQSRGNQSKAAQLLGVTRDTLRYRLKRIHMDH